MKKIDRTKDAVQGESFELGQLTSTLTTGTKRVTHLNYNLELTEIYATAITAPLGATIIIDAFKNGVSILTNKIIIPISGKTSRGTITPAVINDNTLLESDEISFKVLQTGSGTDTGAGIEVFLRGYRLEDTPAKYVASPGTDHSDIFASSLNESTTPSTVYTNIIHVDGKRTDTYVENGSIEQPYKTIAAATVAVNALALAQTTANLHSEANYIIDIARGTYSQNITISNVKNLKFKMHGVYITGNITYTTTMVGGSADNYYSRLEFEGCAGNRPEKGPSGRITGTITGTRNNDSLTYVAFKGIDLQGNIAFNTNGTWVVLMDAVKCTGRISAGDAAIILLETVNLTSISGHIAAAADGTSVTAVSLYNCDNTYFDLINISNSTGSRITNCRFASDVTITAGTVSMDEISYKSMLAQNETLTGATIAYLGWSKPNIYQTGSTTEGIMNVNKGLNMKIPLTGHTTLTMTNLSNGDTGSIIVVQGMSDYTFAIVPTPYVVDSGAGVLTPTAGSGSRTVFSYSYDGTDLNITYSPTKWTNV